MPYVPPDTETYDELDWLEAMGQTDPAGQDVFSLESAESTVQVYLPAAKRKAMKRFVLGFAYGDDEPDAGGRRRLHRFNPIPHPYWDELRAVSVSFRQFGPQGNGENEDNMPYLDSARPDLAVPWYAKYADCYATVAFRQVPYEVWEDDDEGANWSGHEYDRNVDYFHDTGAEVNLITADTGKALKFAEGPADNPLGKPFPGEIAEYLAKMSLVWAWYHVPFDYLCDPAGLPVKLLGCVGRVNSALFAGHPAGTLLLQGVRLQRFLWPYRGTAGQPALGFNVFFHLSHFDPETAVDPPLFRGHNLMPWAYSTAANGSIWYAATRGGGTGDPRYIKDADFATAFDHAQDT